MPAAAIAGPIAGSLIGAIGANKSAKTQANAAAAAAQASQFNPWSTAIGGMQANFNPVSHSVSATMDPTQQAQYGQLGDLFGQLLGGQAPNQGFIDFANGLGNNGLGSMFGNYSNLASQMPTDQFNQTQQTLGGLSGLFGNFGGQLYGQGQQAMQFDPSSMVNTALSNLRAQAAPQQQQQFNMFQNSAFSKGQLGTTGGAQNLQAFMNAQNQQDLGFQNYAQQLGQQQQQIQNNLGLNLMGMGNGLFGQAGQLSQGMLGNALGFNNNALQNYGQALSAGTGLFGMGNQAGLQNYQMGMGALQGQQSMDQMLQSMMQLGGSFGATGAAAGNNAGRYMTSPGATQNPFGALLTGIGTGLAGNNPLGGMMTAWQNRNYGQLDPNQYGINASDYTTPMMQMPSFPG